MMDEAGRRDIGRLAVAAGVVAAGSAACLGTYFVVGGPFGTLNDIGNATTGVLSAALAWRLRAELTDTAGSIATSLAVSGAALTVLGSSLVVSGTTGFMLAGLVSSVGFAGIGAWLIAANRRISRPGPPTLRRTGMVAGSLMALGVVVLPGIAQGIDDVAAAPGWIWLGFAGWLGIYVVLPVWAVWTGLEETRANPARRVGGGSTAADRADPA